MAGLKITDNLDLVKATLSNEPRKKFEETMRLTDYTLGRLFFEDAKMVIGSGKSRKWKIRLRQSNTTRFTRPYNITPNLKFNVMEEAEINWRFLESKGLYDSREEDFNRGEDELISYVDTIESGMWEEAADFLDQNLLKAPISVDDDESLLGLLYWGPKAATGTTSDDFTFGGTTIVYQDGSTGTTAAGIDANDANNTRWTPGVGTYARIDGGFLRLLRQAITRTNFKLLPQLKGTPVKGSGKNILLCGHTTADLMEELLNANDPSGNDPMKVTSETGTLRTMPIMRVPMFDDQGYSDSVIGVNTRHIYGIAMSGRWMKRTTFKHGENPNIIVDQIDSCGQLECNNRRNGIWHLHNAW